MLITLIKKELLSNIMSFRFMLVFLLCCTLIVVSAYTMGGKYSARMREYSTAMSIHRQELEEAQKEGRNLHGIVIGGYKLDKPPAPLSALVEGMEGTAGKFATVNRMATIVDAFRYPGPTTFQAHGTTVFPTLGQPVPLEFIIA